MVLAESKCSNERGFSLVEVLLATMLLVTGVIGTAQMFIIATRGNMAAQRGTYTATLAQEKMEQLRSLAWGFDPVGLPISDYTTNVAVDPPVNGGVGLSASPANALSANVDGYVDYIDRRGRSLGGGATVPPNTIYVRRWSVEPLPSNPNNTLILQVLTFAVGDRDNAGTGDVLDRVPDESRMVSVKTRKSR
jgi:type II secretory pathway pseudopilin PulG